MNRAFRVGHNCQAWCTKCKSETEHVIVAMVDAIPKRVECCGCSTQHNYRLPPGTGKPPLPGRRRLPALENRGHGTGWCKLPRLKGCAAVMPFQPVFKKGTFSSIPVLPRHREQGRSGGED